MSAAIPSPRNCRTRSNAGPRVSGPMWVTNTRVENHSSSGAFPAASSAITTRSNPIANPTAPALSPPISSMRLSYLPPPAVLAELADDRRELRLEGLAVLRAADGAADRVHLGLHAGDADLLEEPEREQDGLRVQQRIGRAERLDAELVELPQAALLRPL